MNGRAFILAAVAMLAPPLGGCVANGAFPSLAMRPGERDLSTEEPGRPAPAIADDSALRERVAELRAMAADGDRSFADSYPAAEAAVAAAGPSGSESWTVAQQALSRLVASPVATMRALAELDQLAVDRADEPTSEADFALIREATAEVEQTAARQQERIDALRARLSRR